MERAYAAPVYEVVLLCYPLIMSYAGAGHCIMKKLLTVSSYISCDEFAIFFALVDYKKT
jgi:hypothetical protein